MSSVSKVADAAREQITVGAAKKGFFRRMAEKLGLVQREVIECRGKSLREIAEMTSKKDAVILKGLSKKETEISELVKKYNALDAKVKEYESMPEYIEW